MAINGGGYTFFSWSTLSLSTSILPNIYTDKTHVLFRIIDKTNNANQPYIITTQITTYAAIPISIQQNAFVSYSSPSNAALGMSSYVFIGFVPASLGAVSGSIYGFTANGFQITFTSCGTNPASYFALFSNINPSSGNFFSFSGNMVSTWISHSLPHPLSTFMPTSYYYFTEVGQGGCGDYQTSNIATKWGNYYGTAFGVR